MKKLILSIVFFTVPLFLVYQGTMADERVKDNMKIKITSGDRVIMANLNNTLPAIDLAKKLPIILMLKSHQNREYYSEIALAKEGLRQNNYQIGDIAYWTIGDSLVLFYDKGYTSNLIIMGQITSGLENLFDMGNSFSAKIEKIED